MSISIRVSIVPKWNLLLCLTINLSSRKIPGLNVYAQMQNEKEQEMTSPVNPTEARPSAQRDLQSLEILDPEFNSRPVGESTLLYTHQSSLACLILLNLHTCLCVCVCVAACLATNLRRSVSKMPDFQSSGLFSLPFLRTSGCFFDFNCWHIHSDLFMSLFISSLYISSWDILHLHSFIHRFIHSFMFFLFCDPARHEALRSLFSLYLWLTTTFPACKSTSHVLFLVKFVFSLLTLIESNINARSCFFILFDVFRTLLPLPNCNRGARGANHETVPTILTHS